MMSSWWLYNAIPFTHLLFTKENKWFFGGFDYHIVIIMAARPFSVWTSALVLCNDRINSYVIHFYWLPYEISNFFCVLPSFCIVLFNSPKTEHLFLKKHFDLFTGRCSNSSKEAIEIKAFKKLMTFCHTI